MFKNIKENMYNATVNISKGLCRGFGIGTTELKSKSSLLVIAFVWPHIYTMAYLDDVYMDFIWFDKIVSLYEMTVFELLVFAFSSTTFFICYFIFKNEVSMNRNHVVATFFFILFAVLFLSRSSSLLSFFFYYELLLLSSVYLV